MNDKRVEAAAWLIGCVLNYECGGDWDKLNDFAKEHYTRVAKYALELSDAASWQPIETAPRDDTVLVYSKNKGYMMIAYKGKYSDEWYDDCGEELGIDDGELTHWQPLPAPPSDATP